MKILTPRRALRLMAEVVAEFGGDHRYQKVPLGDEGPGCVYLYQDESGKDCPSCLVGHVLLRWGLPIGCLWSGNTLGVYSFAMHMDKDESLAFQISKQAVDVLCVAQESQDNGEPWGTALAKAVLFYVGLED